MNYKVELLNDLSNSKYNFKKGDVFIINDIWLAKRYHKDILVELKQDDKYIITSLSEIKIIEVIIID